MLVRHFGQEHFAARNALTLSFLEKYHFDGKHCPTASEEGWNKSFGPILLRRLPPRVISIVTRTEGQKTFKISRARSAKQDRAFLAYC